MLTLNRDSRKLLGDIDREISDDTEPEYLPSLRKKTGPLLKEMSKNMADVESALDRLYANMDKIETAIEEG